jgi:hypothetical protein
MRRQWQTKVFGWGFSAWLAAGAAACGGAAVDTSIPLDEVRQLNNSLALAYARANDLLIASSQASAEAGQLPGGVTADDFDVAMFREVVAACFTQSLQLIPGAVPSDAAVPAVAAPGDVRGVLTRRPDVGRARPCNPSRLLALETYLQVVGPDLAAFLQQRLLEIDALRVNLADVLPRLIDELERRTDAAEAEAIVLRNRVEQRRAIAQGTLPSEEERQTNEQRYNLAIDELNEVDALIAQVRAELRDARSLRRQLVDETVRNIASLGTTP